MFPRLFLTRKRHGRVVAPGPDRTAIVSLFASTQMFCGPDWLGQKAAL
ncbi:hypothetical protein ACBQ08_13380 [Aneurinibacillus aneurinilyticus]